MSDRLGWFWLFAQPILIVLVMVSIRTVVMGRVKTIAGAEFVPWLVIGLLGFQLFREIMIRSLGAIDTNKRLFSYRQVKPIDPVFVRTYVDGVLHTFIFLMFIFASLLMNISLIPAYPVHALFIWFSLWTLGVGIGLVLSVLATIFPEIKKIVTVVTLPLMILSGVIFPLNYIPFDLQQYLLLNPIVHGLELLRVYFYPSYQTIPGISLTYLWLWIFSLFSLGLMMHLRFEERLKVL